MWFRVFMYVLLRILEYWRNNTYKFMQGKGRNWLMISKVNEEEVQVASNMWHKWKQDFGLVTFPKLAFTYLSKAKSFISP